MSTLAVNSITDANGGSNTVVNGVVSSPGGMMFRNRIINGDMKVYQRAQTYSGVTGTGYYTADRARTSMSGAGTATVDYEVLLNQNVDGTIMNALKSVVTTTDPGRLVRYNQRIEPLNMIDMSGKEVTLSFYAKADTSLTLNNIAFSDNGTGSLTSVSFSSVNLTTSWQRFTFTGTLDDLTTSSYLDVIIGLSGDTGNLTAATWYITGVQLELGSVATPFERRPYGMELALCQRYYQEQYYSWEGNTGYGTTGSFTPAPLSFNTAMRSSPTSTHSNVIKSASISLHSMDYPTLSGARVILTIPTGYQYYLAKISFSAEL